jgi:hypothetical protein
LGCILKENSQIMRLIANAQKPSHEWLGFCAVLSISVKRSGSASGKQVRDQRNHRKNDQQVNEEAGDMHHEKTARPEENENNGQNKKHGVACLE